RWPATQRAAGVRRRFARQALVQPGAEPVDVAALVDVEPLLLLRRSVPRGPERDLGIRESGLRPLDPRDAEIEQLDPGWRVLRGLRIAGEEQVAGFHVAVNDARGVHGRERVGRLEQD